MRRIGVLRILALSATLILALGGMCATQEEDTSDTGEPTSADAPPPDTDELPSYELPSFEWTPPNTDELPSDTDDPTDGS